MATIRVYELAKELGLDNKEMMARLRQLKIPVKGHMSVIAEEDVERLRQSLAASETTSAAGGVEEKRVTREVIRRRSRPAPPAPEEEKPKVDLTALKKPVKRVRAEEEEEEETSRLLPPESLKGLPKKWTEEEREEERARTTKAPRRRKSAPLPEPTPSSTSETEAVSPAAGEEPSSVPPSEPPPATAETAPEPPPPVESKAGQPAAVPTPAKKTETQPEEYLLAEVEEKEVPAPRPPAPRRIYIKPFIRKTARAVEGEPLPIPGQAPPAPTAEAEKVVPLEEAGKKKKKKKKKKKGEEEVAPENEVLELEPPKRRLRRKIAFKIHRSMEGMEYADIEQIYMPSKKKAAGKKKSTKKTLITTPKAAKRIIRMGETILVSDLARQLGVKLQEIIKALANDGVTATEDQPLDLDLATLVAAAYEYEINQEVFDETKILGEMPAPKPEHGRPRPPVVTVMGHVDHGKTSLLDTIRKTRVTEEEAGAITQHIGASVVQTSSGTIVFIDTPGHEAFTAMRARGAKITDIVVLVVAADDGIMPQTLEAIDHARAANVPIIVALNKIDLPQARPATVKQRLAELGLQPEEWGGETMVIECSAKTGQGIPDLLEAILLQAELLELTADPGIPAQCFVIESRLDKGRGPVATVIVQQGTLRLGDPILCGPFYGRVRAMIDDRGTPLKEAAPSQPVEIMGLSGLPDPGELLLVVSEERKARTVAEYREEKMRLESAVPAPPVKVTLEDLMARLEQGEVQSLNLVIKSDTHGSAEALRPAVEKLSLNEVKVSVLHGGVGNITENDVLLASASSAVILGFNVKIEAKARKLAEDEGVQIRIYDVIYHLLDDVKASLQGLLKPTFAEEIIGTAEVRKVFHVSKVGTVAGAYVASGVIKRSARARVRRGEDIIYTGKFKSLKRLQDDVREVAAGLECGIALENFQDLQEGDVIEAYEVTESAPG